MKWFISLLAMAMLTIATLFSMPSTASADTMQFSLTLLTPTLMVEAQTDATADPQAHKTSWGALKAIYRGNTPLPYTAERTQQSATLTQKPGVGMMAGTAANQQWWSGLNQNQRNSLIVQTAYNYLITMGGSQTTASARTGYSCKTWVQSYVVPTASRGVATIPATRSACCWYAGQYVSIVGYGPTGVNIGGAVPGNIVQTYWPGSGLHTFIIYSRTSAGDYWIDCNFSVDLDTRIRIHYMSFSDFEKNSGGNYTVYQVIGG